MSGSRDVIKAEDRADATVSAQRTLQEGAEIRGYYTAELLRVKPEHLQEAELLSAEIRLKETNYPTVGVAAQLAAEREVNELVERLKNLPRDRVWVDQFPNVVTTVGKNDVLDKYLGGSSYTQTVRMGLCGTGTKAAADTQASHSGWSEVGLANAPAYSGNRPSPSFSSASGGVKSTSSAVAFTFTSGGTVAGCFLNNGGSATKDDTTGVLVSAGDFSGGSKTVANTDVLNVTYSLTLT